MDFDALQLEVDRTITAHLGEQLLQYRTHDGLVVDLWDHDTGKSKAIFSRAYVKVDAYTAPISSTGPAAFVRLEDLPVDPATDDGTFLVNGAVYDVIDVHVDGKGGAVLVLHAEGA